MMMPFPLEDSPLAVVASQAALKAGKLLREGFGTQFEITSKANPLDLVTEFDKAAEALIIDFIKSQFNGHAFLAEESGFSEYQGADVLWIIDPLDGTMNFAHHIPFFVVSIAAVVDQSIEVGVIYQPINQELFVAQKGRGSYLNGSKIHVSKAVNLAQAVGATGFPYSFDERKHYTTQFLNFLNVGNPIRIIGSAALNLAYVATGRFDLYWGNNLMPWDVAAGKLLVEEAGGQITHFDGSSYDAFKEANIVATNGTLHNAILNLLK